MIKTLTIQQIEYTCALAELAGPGVRVTLEVSELRFLLDNIKALNEMIGDSPRFMRIGGLRLPLPYREARKPR